MYVDGICGKLANGTDALNELGRALRAAGTRLEEVVNCFVFRAQRR